MPTDDGSTLQLRLSLSSNTSFKRSFQELFGGAESDGEQGDDSGLIGVSHGTNPVGHAGRVNGREGRNKRQRSESQGDNSSSSASASASTDSSSDSLASSLVLSPRTSTSGTTDNRFSGRTPTRSSLPNGTQEASLPPRLPTPRLDDVQMSDIPLLDEVRDDENITHATLQAEAAVASASGSGSEGLTSSHSRRSGVLQEPPHHLQRYQQQYQPQYQARTQHSSSSSSPLSSPSSPSPLLGPSTILTPSNHPTGSTITNLNLDLTQLSNEHATDSMGSLRLGLFSSSPGPVPLSSLSVSRNPSRTGPPETEERFRATMERYNAFESAMAALRRSVSPPPPRGLVAGAVPATSPPRLPPLELSSLGDVEGDNREELQESIRLPEVVAATPTITNIDDTSSLPIRRTHRNGFTHANLGLPSIGGDSDHTADRDDEDDELDELDEGSADEDEDDVVLLHNHQHPHTRQARADATPLRDAPPRIELSNSLWSSFGVGGSGRNSIAVVDEERAVAAEMERQEEQDDPVYPDPSFRDRLDSALEVLRSPSSPLVPGLVGAGSHQDENPTELHPESSSAPLPLSMSNATTSQTQIPLSTAVSNTVASPNRGSTLPTLPPILIDSANNEWGRDLPVPHDRHLRRVSREEYDRRTLQRLGEVQVPSPSLSGFYDWLEGASANVPPSGTGSRSTLGSNGLNMVTNAETQAPSQDQGDEARSWEEEVLSGFVNTRLGLSFGLPQRDREEHGPLPPEVSSPGPDTGQSAADGVVMDVDMESDAEREREVERLPWTLGTSISSSNQPISRNLNLESRRPIQPMPEQYRRLNLLHDEWDPRLPQGRGQAEAGPSTSAQVPLVSENDMPLPSFSSSLFSSPSPPLPSPQPTASAHLALLSSTSPPRQNPPSPASRARLPSSILSPRRSSALSSSSAGYEPVPRAPGVGSTTRSSNRTSLPPSLSLDLGLNNSIFGLSNTSVSDYTHITPNDNNDVEADVSSEPTQQNSLTNIFEPPPPRTHWRLHEALSAADSGGLRAPTRVLGSSNSLVAENAAEMRRRYARAELVRRLGASQRSLRSSVSNLGSGRGSSLSSSTSAESSTNLNLQSGVSGDGEGTELNFWGRQGETGSERVTSTRGEQRLQPQTQSRLDLLSHSQLHRGNFFGTFGGLGLPPRNSGSPMNRGLHASRGSESGSNIASNTGASLYSGVVPPPPRPRLHSVRRVLSPVMPESAGSDSSSTDGRRRSTSWSLEANTPNVDEGVNANRTLGSRPATSGEAFVAMLGLQLPPNQEHSRRPSLLYAESESDRDSSSVDGQQNQRNARTSVDSLGSSDSAVSSESLVGSGYGSGVSSASVYGATTTVSTLPGRAMFLDTELPSPGLGELFDTLGSPSNNNLSISNNSHPNRNSLDPPLSSATGFSSAPLSAPASATTFNSSGSSGYFSPLGRFTPSPVRTSDEDVEVEGSANDVHRMGTGLRRTDSDNVLGWLNRDWDEEPMPGAGEMDVDGNQRDRYRNQTTSDENQSEPRPRPPLQEPRFTPITLPLRNDFISSGSRARDTIPPAERRHVIDPTLFAPGPFRNTMETLAMTARDYAARVSSSSAASRAATTMSSPVTSLSSPSPSSDPSPVRQTFTPRSHHPITQPNTSLFSQGATAQSPPVIPPLSFEDVPNVLGSDNTGMGTQRERTEERHIAGNATHQLANERHPMLRQGGLGDYLRLHEERRRREAGNVSTGGVGVSSRQTLFGSASSASSISSSEGMHWSWSHLERSPGGSEGGASATHTPITSNYGAAPAPTDQARSGGETEGLEHAIGVMRGDGLSLERSLQFWRGFYRDQMRGRSLDVHDETQVPPRSSAASQAQVQNRNPGSHNRDQGSRSFHVPRWRYGHQMSPTTSTTMTTTSTSTTISNNNVTGPSPLLNVDRTRSRLSYPSWHDVVLNRPSSMEDVLEGIDSDSADDEDFEALLSLSRPSTAAPVGPRAPRLESFNRLANRYRPGGVNANANTINPGSGSGSGGVRSGSGLGGITGRREPDLPHFPRILRERMTPRYRPPSTLGAGESGGGGTGNGPGTSGGRRFSGFARRFGNLGDYVNDEDFDASYESLLTLQAALGDVRPRSTPDAVLRRLKSAKYREWADEESDARCPICLEEYAQDDMVMKSGNCKHWLHKACLEQWLKTANTCPVCRTDVEPRPTQHHPRCPRLRMFSPRREGPGGSGGNRNGNAPGSGSSSGGNSGSNNTDSNPGRSSSGHNSRLGGGPF